MTKPRVSAELTDTSIAAGEHTSMTLLLDPGTSNGALETLAAFTLRIRLPSSFFSNVGCTALSFDSMDATGLQYTYPVGEQGILTLAGARLTGVAGPVDLAEIAFTLDGPEGASIHIVVEVLDAITMDGRRLSVPTETFHVRVATNGPHIVDTPLRSARVTEPYHTILKATGGQQPYTWSLSGSLPPGLVLNEAGFISGTPSSTGTYSAVVRVTDSSEPDSLIIDAQLELRVISAPLQIVTLELPSVAPATEYHVDLESSGGLEPITWEVECLPDGLALDGSSIAGTMPSLPTGDTQIEVHLTVKDSESSPQTVTKTVMLPIVAMLPTQQMETENPCAVAIGRDLLAVNYRIDLEVQVHLPFFDQLAPFEDRMKRITDFLKRKYAPTEWPAGLMEILRELVRKATPIPESHQPEVGEVDPLPIDILHAFEYLNEFIEKNDLQPSISLPNKTVGETSSGITSAYEFLEKFRREEKHLSGFPLIEEDGDLPDSSVSSRLHIDKQLQQFSKTIPVSSPLSGDPNFNVNRWLMPILMVYGQMNSKTTEYGVGIWVDGSPVTGLSAKSYFVDDEAHEPVFQISTTVELTPGAHMVDVRWVRYRLRWLDALSTATYKGEFCIKKSGSKRHIFRAFH